MRPAQHGSRNVAHDNMHTYFLSGTIFAFWKMKAASRSGTCHKFVGLFEIKQNKEILTHIAPGT